MFLIIGIYTLQVLAFMFPLCTIGEAEATDCWILPEHPEQ